MSSAIQAVLVTRSSGNSGLRLVGESQKATKCGYPGDLPYTTIAAKPGWNARRFSRMVVCSSEREQLS
jgi:hypothetical protein